MIIRERLKWIVTGRHSWNHLVGLTQELLGTSQDCPRRLGGVGPWSSDANGQDRWVRGRWGTKASRAVIRFFHGDSNSRAYRLFAKIQRYPPYIGGTRWHWSWAPRDCSFCGGVHPEDLLRLIREGWEVEGTTKAYKAYLHPPGYRAAMERIMRFKRFPDGPSESETWSPVPPVKLYLHHFTQTQVGELNSLLSAKGVK